MSLAGRAESACRSPRAMGTPGYMAPEQAGNEPHQIDARADVFALGSILCEILTGEPAYATDKRLAARDHTARPDPSAAMRPTGGLHR